MTESLGLEMYSINTLRDLLIVCQALFWDGAVNRQNWLNVSVFLVSISIQITLGIAIPYIHLWFLVFPRDPLRGKEEVTTQR